MAGKNSKDIANALQDIYYEHGPPRVIQCDQGTEFKGAIKKLCKRFEIKIICSRPYHPQSQGKVERSHKTLRAKIEYDLAKMCDKNVSWASGLPIYQRILNEDPKEVLAYKTPFQVYFGRKCNSFQTIISNNEIAACCEPTRQGLKERFKHISNVRKMARDATHRCSKRMTRQHSRAHPPSQYNIGEKVYLRLPKKGGLKSAPKKRVVIEAVIQKRNLHRHIPIKFHIYRHLPVREK